MPNYPRSTPGFNPSQKEHATNVLVALNLLSEAMMENQVSFVAFHHLRVKSPIEINRTVKNLRRLIDAMELEQAYQIYAPLN